MIMNYENQINNKLSFSELLTYLDIATKYRNHEFNIQMVRNAIYTGFNIVLITVYANNVRKEDYLFLLVALFGISFTILWYIYYKSSQYWTWYWEEKCRKINDYIVSSFQIYNIDLFQNHLVGKNIKHPPAFIYGGKKIKYIGVHKIIKITQILFLILWISCFVLKMLMLLHYL
jgi:hypothetical protein